MSDPATANSFTLIPIRFRISSPINKKIISTKAAIIEALPLLMVPFFSRKEIMIGILPTMSITANNTIVAVAISLKLKLIRLSLGCKIRNLKTSAWFFAALCHPGT
jgi:hypothetical protein